MSVSGKLTQINRPRVLHANHFRHVAPGVIHQLSAEASAVNKLGIPWEIDLICDKKENVPFLRPIPPTRLKSLLLSRLYFWNWLLRRRKDFDFLLLRHVPADPFAPLFTPFFPNRASIHHTKEIEELLARDGRFGRLWSASERLIGKRTIRSGKAVIGVTGEILNYELRRIREPKPGYVSPNGIDVEAVPLAGDRREGVAQILFVASVFSPWHGLDLLLDSLSRCAAPYHLHLVGEISTATLARVRANDHGDGKIILHGKLSQEEVFDVSSACDLGLASFNFSGLGMEEACTLKVREYLAQGLPVYSGHRDAGLPVDFPYYEIGPVDMDAIVRMALAMRNVSRVTVRTTAVPWIDKVALIERLYTFLCSVYESEGLNGR